MAAGLVQVADPPSESPHTVAGAPTGSANEFACADCDPDAVDVVLLPPQEADAGPTELPHTVTGAAAGTAAAGPLEVAALDVALFVGVPVVPHDPDAVPTPLPHTVTGAATGAAAPPAEPVAPVDVAVPPPHWADVGPPRLAALPQTVTGAVTGTAAADPELVSDGLLVELGPGALALVPLGDSTDAALPPTYTGAETGTSTEFADEPGVVTLASTFAVVVCPAAEETGWVTGLPSGPIASALLPTVTGTLALTCTAGSDGVEGVAADAIPAPSNHAPPVKMPA